MDNIAVYDKFDSFLQQHFCIPLKVENSRALGGGCIGDVHRLMLKAEPVKNTSVSVDGENVPKYIVVKQNRSPQAREMCTDEAEGLVHIAGTNTIAVPKVLAIIRSAGESCIVLSYIARLAVNRVDRGTDSIKSSNKENSNKENFWDLFARQLACMHRARTNLASNTKKRIEGNATKSRQYDLQADKHTDAKNIEANAKIGTESTTRAQAMFGFASDNFIGSTPQTNTPCTSWVEFYRSNRLWAQFRLAEQNKYFDSRLLGQAEQLCNRLESLISEPEHPSLLHGDLWSGNYMQGAQGEPVLIDPAVYYGHYEADIAMTELFGGFDAEFYASYSSQFMLDKEYHRTRKQIYNLYHLLNHLNIFGISYLGSVRNIMSAFI